MKNHPVMWRVLSLVVGFFAALSLIASPVLADGKKCKGLPTEDQLQQFLRDAATGTGISGDLGPGTGVGGLFDGTRMWAAVVNRAGELCAAATSTDDPTQVWPGSQSIAKSKAETGNNFSLDILALSTANLYTFVLPGHSLHSLAGANPFNPNALTTPNKPNRRRGKVNGGNIFFGGGFPLYTASSPHTIIGGLGVSGDTSCADHEIGKRVRNLAGLDPADGPLADEIDYDPTSILAHPTCINTLQNGTLINANEVPVPLP